MVNLNIPGKIFFDDNEFSLPESEKSNKALLTIIIPVFNKANYLPGFLNCCNELPRAICKLLFIDDGSIDESFEILNEYKNVSTPGFVHVIRCTRNNGVSIARQIGLVSSDSQFVTFADPDDEFNQSHYLNLLALINESNADICWSDFKRKKDRVIQRVSQKFNEDPKVLVKQILMGKLHSGLWNKIFRKHFLTTHNITFPFERVAICEDFYFLLSALSKNPTVAYTMSSEYIYIDNSSSLSSMSSLETFRSLVFISSLLNETLDMNLFGKFLHAWRGGVYMSGCLNPAIEEKDFLEYSVQLGPYSYDNLSFKVKILCVFASLGLRNFILKIISLKK